MIHASTNDLAKGVNTMKRAVKLVKVIHNFGQDFDIQIGFLSAICKTDRSLEKQVNEINIKLKEYCGVKGFIFC